ncbi:MAG: hypothetical protein II348_02035, partial [Clostridia bacterium]|nr:hypothetical protein [Clostridia bacterium]
EKKLRQRFFKVVTRKKTLKSSHFFEIPKEKTDKTEAKKTAKLLQNPGNSQKILSLTKKNLNEKRTFYDILACSYCHSVDSMI